MASARLAALHGQVWPDDTIFPQVQSLGGLLGIAVLIELPGDGGLGLRAQYDSGELASLEGKGC